MQKKADLDRKIQGIPKQKIGVYRKCFKRPADFILSVFALVVLSPVFVVVAVLVRIKLGKPVLFKQQRPGLNEELFTLYKFRTMTDEIDQNGEPLPDAKRLTKFGRMLRGTSIDELPELLNIAKGDMSLIGPRPLAVQYLPYYTQEEKKRHSVRPGLSGLAQINGRNIISWEQRFEYDIQYVNTITFKQDIRLIIKTIGKVFRREAIGERGVDSPIDFDVYRQNNK